MSGATSVDLTLIFSYASQIVNAMMPLIGMAAGFCLGFGLIDKTIQLFYRATNT
jgi:hypothetical protein